MKRSICLSLGQTCLSCNMVVVDGIMIASLQIAQTQMVNELGLPGYTHQTFGPCRYSAAFSTVLGVGVGAGMTGFCMSTIL